MRLSVVLVHYHTPEFAAAAVASLHADLAGQEKLSYEIVVVDNGSDQAERARLACLPVTILEPGTNLGYAGAANLGVTRTSGDLVVLMNPDVLVLPGCLAALTSALGRDADIAGPRLFWDESRRLLLPPAEPRTRRWEVLAVLAGRNARWAGSARGRFRKHARRHWNAAGPLPSEALSGSLLAFRRDAWMHAGPFDAGFPLYFEETDWLRRARRRGLRSLYVPAAEAVHRYARSSDQEPRAVGWFEESARRFRDRHYGSGFRRMLEALAARRPPATGSGRQVLPTLPKAGLDLSQLVLPIWVEVSPNPSGFPAAAERVVANPGQWSLPAEVQEPAGLCYRLVTDDGRELAERPPNGRRRRHEPAY